MLQFAGTGNVPSTPATGSIVINGGVLSTAGNTAAAWLASGKIAASPTGTLALAANDNSALNFSGGTLNNLSLGSIGANTFSGTITPGGNGYLLGGGGGTLTLASNTLNAAANLTVNGNLVIASTQSYTGSTTLTSGVLQLAATDTGSGGPLGIGGSITFAGGTLQYSAANTYDYSGRLTAGANEPYSVDTNGQNVTWGSALTSTGGSLTKLGNGILTLGGANTYGGSTLMRRHAGPGQRPGPAKQHAEHQRQWRPELRRADFRHLRRHHQRRQPQPNEHGRRGRIPLRGRQRRTTTYSGILGGAAACSRRVAAC